MAFWRIITLAFCASLFVEAKYQQKKRETISNICDPTYNNISSVQCYCVADPRYHEIVRSAECHLTKRAVLPDDKSWDGFEKLRNATKLTLSDARGIILEYVPTKAITMIPTLLKLEVKYSNIEKIESFAFANLSLIEEITLSNNQIKILAVHAFAHHRDLSVIGLDTNEIVEINRNVFVDLPSLEKLYLTNNKITTIHDKAFIHLLNLRELEIDRNGIFSLNSDTFSGLKKLERLDLSGNSLEVIGDNTYLPLINLRSLNLDGNKIQMLDEKAFHGLNKLNSLSLARNNLTSIVNEKTFEGLHSLTHLSLKSNQLVELKSEVIAPILINFYGNSSNFDVEDNSFPCECRLDWFMTLMNKTQNNHLKLALENLKCKPSDTLRDLYTKAAELEKTTVQAFEDDAVQTQNGDYEYYDEEQLNGKLFYMDVRDLANCTKAFPILIPLAENEVNSKPSEKKVITETTKATTPSLTTRKPVTSTNQIKDTKTTTLITGTTERMMSHHVDHKNKPNEDNETKNKDSFTTVRLATVSAKPLEHDDKLFDQNMASDEARPERIKAHRSIQDDEAMKYKTSKAHANISSVVVVAIMLSFRLCY